MTMKDFFGYCDSVQEEMPMYMFDHDFGENAPTLLDDFIIPDYFREDLFELLGILSSISLLISFVSPFLRVHNRRTTTEFQVATGRTCQIRCHVSQRSELHFCMECRHHWN